MFKQFFFLRERERAYIWCRRGLNFRSLIQPSETLLVELTGTHMFKHMYKYKYNNKIANIIISTTME